jgi:hypothetical protein
MIRDLGFIKWEQESSWMEKMSGERWDSMVKKENKTFLNKLNVSKETLITKAEDFKNAKKNVSFTYDDIIVNYISKNEVPSNGSSKHGRSIPMNQTQTLLDLLIIYWKD